MHEDPDPLEPLLAPPRGPFPRREEIFSSTLAELRWRNRLRRFGAVAVLLAAYGAGLITMLACPCPTARSPVAEVRPWEKPAPEPPAERTSAATREWQALEQPESAARLYRAAADQYLSETDPAQAVRCYGASLDAGREESLDVSTDDSWLLMAIKNARKKERNECGR